MAEVRIPGSKSVTARALFLGACAPGLTYLRRPLLSDDTEAFAEGLAALGYSVQLSGDDWILMGSPSGPPAPSADVYCRDAGTAARFLPALRPPGTEHSGSTPPRRCAAARFGRWSRRCAGSA